jgi:hypothetical protein
MKRYLCTVASGLLLALASTGTATAGLPLVGQSGTQVTSFGDQTVGEHENDADVTQAQGNGNLNIAPAVAIFGDAETWNAQGNGNTATANVDQSNAVEQSQSSTQKQVLDQNGSCCDGQSQAGTQTVYGGDQSVEKQTNEADVEQWQGNGNINVSPAIALFGDAETWNAQGNGNTATANVDQSNAVEQSQSSTQKQTLRREGGMCCKPRPICESKYECSPKGHSESPEWKKEKGDSCCDGQSQTGEQETTFGDQTVGKQKNDADVSQKQGNGNVNVSPAIALGGKHGSCRASCEGSWPSHGGDAKTVSGQGNGNTAGAWIDQSNAVTQTQEARQFQSLAEWCKGLVTS